MATNTWTSNPSQSDYDISLTYDENGNIMTNKRNAHNGTGVLPMDDMVYEYEAQRNRLHKVSDQASLTPNFAGDIDGENTYTYDATGNLVREEQSDGTALDYTWNNYGKLKSVIRSVNMVVEQSVVFAYDPMGNRISKAVTNGLGNTTNTTTTYYVRDAQGNLLANYTLDNSGALALTERDLYGSKRLGVDRPGLLMTGAGPAGSCDFTSGGMQLGRRFYELTDHLGNVLATVSDKKLGAGNVSGNYDHYEAELASVNDYYPFGMLMPNRELPNNSEYRFGFNGKESDNDIKGQANSIDYGARLYDPRICRWLSVDPLESDYPHLSPYIAFENNPIYFDDPDGMNARYKIKGNTITITAVLYIAGAGANAKKAEQMQRLIMKKWNRQFKSKGYNVKFDIKVTVYREGDKNQQENLSNGTGNLITLSNTIKRSYVTAANGETGGGRGVWESNTSDDDVYGHEFGHLVGLADQYWENWYSELSQPHYAEDYKLETVNFKGIKQYDIMGKAANNYKSDAVVNQWAIDVIVSYILNNKENKVDSDGSIVGRIQGGLDLGKPSQEKIFNEVSPIPTPIRAKNENNARRY